MRLFVLARHAQSTLNHERRINGDPTVPAPLTERGREEARLLGVQLSGIPLDLCIHTRFQRTRETAEIALADRGIQLVEEPLLDDVKIGELEGQTIEEYRAWKRVHGRGDRFPGGESLDEAAGRYARGYRQLLTRAGTFILVVCHEVPIRYALNAIAGSDDLDAPVHDVPNSTPVLFGAHELAQAAERINELA